MIKRQPTAIAFTRTQEKFAKHILEKVQAEIAAIEATMEDPDLNPSDYLCDLYDDEVYWIRFADHMRQQREYLHQKYGIEY